MKNLCNISAVIISILLGQAVADTDSHHEKWRCGVPDLTLDEVGRSRLEVESFWADNATRDNDPVYILVAWHVVYSSTGEGNISDASIQSAVDKLNDTFNEPFNYYFTLGTVDRTMNDDWYLFEQNEEANQSEDEQEMRQALQIDPVHYYNIYSIKTEVHDGYITMGWNYYPMYIPENSIWQGTTVNWQAANYSGQTITHECGHYFGLLHTFQGGCSGGDAVDDTPDQDDGDNIYECNESLDTCPNDPGNDPVHNIMNYSPNACRWEYTGGQADRAYAIVEAYHPGLLENTDDEASVYLSMSSGSAGLMETVELEINMSNDGPVGGLQFDLTDTPDYVDIVGVSTTLRTTGFTADYNEVDGGVRVVVLGTDNNNIDPGEGAILGVSFQVQDDAFAGDVVGTVQVDFSNIYVGDGQGSAYTVGDPEPGMITIDFDILLSLSSGTADVSETLELDINMSNTGPVGGLQFDLTDTPNDVEIIGLSTTPRTTGFTADYNEIDGGVRVVVLGTGNNNIDTGEGNILRVSFQVHDDAFAGDVAIDFSNIYVGSETGSAYLVGNPIPGMITVYPGYIEEPHNLAAQSGMDAQVLLTWDPPYGPIPPEFTEDFEGGEIPADWTVLTNGNGWNVTENGSSAFWNIPSHTYYAVTNDDGFNGENTPDNDGNDYLLMPSFNMSGATNVILNFASYYDGAYGEIATVEASTDGVNFEVVHAVAAATEWVMTAVDLSEYGDQQNVTIAFHGNDNGVWASGWAVDDILITFSSAQVSRNLHFELTELGQWFVTADKEEVVGTYPSGVPFDWRIDLDNPLPPENRPVDIDEYNIYRSVGDDQNFEFLESVDGDQTSYLDENVINSTTYSYYVTAVYPSGVESGPTNTVEATPVEWVELWMSDGQSLTAQMDTLNFYLNNESQVGLFYFEIEDWPDILHSVFILTTERTQSWALEIVDMANGNMAITGISLGEPLEPGDGVVCRAVVYPISDEETTVTLTYADASVQDVNYVEMNWTAESAVYEVTIETQYLTLTGGYGIPGAQMTSSLLLQNTQPVFGIQIDIIADPPFMMGAGLEVSDLIDFSTWSISGDQIGAAYRILLYDNTLSQPIPPGLRHLANINLDMLDGSPEGEMITLGFGETVISDINNLPMHTVGSPADVYIGQPPVAYSIHNVTGGLTPGGTGSFDIHMTNTAYAFILEMRIADVPEYLTVTGITPLDRFENGTIDGSSGEDDDQMFYFLGYDFATGIMPGEGPILRVDVEMNQNIQNPSVMLLFESVATGDDGANPVTSVADGFGQFTVSLSTSADVVLPGKFALHPNYPNPFNPATLITYDLPAESDIQLVIYDLMGRKVKTLINDVESAGRKTAVWYATDDFGNPVSAGVYLYRLHGGDKTFTRKMILMK